MENWNRTFKKRVVKKETQGFRRLLFIHQIKIMSTIWIKDGKDQIVHKVNTLEIHQNVSQAAKEMKDTKTLAKLAEGDMIAREACY